MRFYVTGKCLLALVFTLFFLFGATARAAIITLSTHSSDGTIYTEAEHLDATMEFTVVDNALTLEVTNLTGGAGSDYEFGITEFYFNYNDDVHGVAWLDGPALGWLMHDNQDGFHVDGFGWFDVRVYINPQPNKTILSGDSKTFEFAFAGSGTVDDFTSYLSADDTGEDTPGLVAATFVGGGPNDTDSAAGMTIPEPATMLMLGLGSLCMLRRRKT